MSFDEWIFQNKWIEIIISGIIGWLISKILDPKSGSTNNPPSSSGGSSVNQVIVYVREHTGRGGSGSNNADEAYNLSMMLIGLSAAVILYAMTQYGVYVVYAVRVMVAAVGFAAIFLWIRISASNAFKASSWMPRLIIVVLSCIILWVSLNYVEEGIINTIVRAQNEGVYIRNLPDLFKNFGIEGAFRLGHFAMALMMAVLVSIIALIAQTHMLLLAHAATAFNINDWRIKLLGFMGNKSSIVNFVIMVLFSGMTFVVASGLLQQLFKR
jgi:hypothetical protein